MTAGSLRSVAFKAPPRSPVVFTLDDGTELHAVGWDVRTERGVDPETGKPVYGGTYLILTLARAGEAAACSCAAADAVPVPERTAGFINPEPPGSRLD